MDFIEGSGRRHALAEKYSVGNGVIPASEVAKIKEWLA